MCVGTLDFSIQVDCLCRAALSRMPPRRAPRRSPLTPPKTTKSLHSGVAFHFSRFSTTLFFLSSAGFVLGRALVLPLAPALKGSHLPLGLFAWWYAHSHMIFFFMVPRVCQIGNPGYLGPTICHITPVDMLHHCHNMLLKWCETVAAPIVLFVYFPLRLILLGT